MQYVVVYEQGETSWGAYVPDLPGCVAVGDTREEVEQLIQEAAMVHVEVLSEHDEQIPQPGTWTGLIEVALPSSPRASMT